MLSSTTSYDATCMRLYGGRCRIRLTIALHMPHGAATPALSAGTASGMIQLAWGAVLVTAFGRRSRCIHHSLSCKFLVQHTRYYWPGQQTGIFIGTGNLNTHLLCSLCPHVQSDRGPVDVASRGGFQRRRPVVLRMRENTRPVRRFNSRLYQLKRSDTPHSNSVLATNGMCKQTTPGLRGRSHASGSAGTWQHTKCPPGPEEPPPARRLRRRPALPEPAWCLCKSHKDED